MISRISHGSARSTLSDIVATGMMSQGPRQQMATSIRTDLTISPKFIGSPSLFRPQGSGTGDQIRTVAEFVFEVLTEKKAGAMEA